MKDRILEVAICIESFIIMVLLCIVVYFITENMYSRYDVDRDGKITLSDASQVYNAYMESKNYVWSIDENGNVTIIDKTA